MGPVVVVPLEAFQVEGVLLEVRVSRELDCWHLKLGGDKLREKEERERKRSPIRWRIGSPSSPSLFPLHPLF